MKNDETEKVIYLRQKEKSERFDESIFRLQFQMQQIIRDTKHMAVDSFAAGESSSCLSLGNVL